MTTIRINAMRQTDDDPHDLSEAEQLRYPGGKDGMWVVTCSCGYSTAPSGYPGHAERDAGEHRRAKLAGQQRTY